MTATTVTAYKWASKHFSYRRPICNISKMKRLLVANQTDEKGFRLQVLQHHNHSKSWLKVAICARLLLCMPTKKVNRSTSIDDRCIFCCKEGHDIFKKYLNIYASMQTQEFSFTKPSFSHLWSFLTKRKHLATHTFTKLFYYDHRNKLLNNYIFVNKI